MRVHAITHVPYEGPAAISRWAHERRHEITVSLALTEDYPEPRDVGLLVIMGGPMDADDEVASPWLPAEKRFVASVLDAGGRVLGVCLGSQILAEVLGGQVRRNAEREIGWFEVRLTPAGRAEPLFTDWPDAFMCGHWHGDTFDLPHGIETSASSDACANQLFVARDGAAVGVQFHLEWDAPGLSELVAECEDDLVEEGTFIVPPAAMLQGVAEHGERCRALLYAMLDRMAYPGDRAVLG